MRAARLAAVGLLAAGCTAAPIDVAQYTAHNFANGLVAYWSFDDISHTTLPDDSGNINDGMIQGATPTPGKFGSALQFKDNQQVDVTMFSPRAEPTWTVSVWARVDDMQPGGVDPTQPDTEDFVTLISTEIPLVSGWEMNVVSTTTPMRYHFGYYVGPNPGDYDFVECACVTPNVWTHVAAVVDNTKMSMDLYVNGVLAAPQVTTRKAITAGTSTRLYMASWYNAMTMPPPTRYLAGALDDVAIWQRPLLPSEIAILAGSRPLMQLK